MNEDTVSRDGDFWQWIVSMPKAEIHIHLEGTVVPETLLALADRYGRVDDLPGKDVAAIRRWMAFTDFDDFIDKYLFIVNLLRTEDDFHMLVDACGQDMARQGIRYREVTVTPYLHTASRHDPISFETLLSGLEAGRTTAKEKYAVEIRWIFDVPRNASFVNDNPEDYDPRPANETLANALQAIDFGCVGFGLGGSEVGAPPEPFAHAFARAKEAGLRSVPHAGETTGPNSIWGAIRDLQADRIGHGVRAIEDPALLAYLKERRIPLEVNVTSNICLHVYPSVESHPFAHLDRMGLLLTINSDDPPLFDTSFVQEYYLLHDVFGYAKSEIARIARNAIEVAAVEAGVRRKLLVEFDRWARLQVPIA
jgi:aminodeoxyfutalosine deaminase